MSSQIDSQFAVWLQFSMLLLMERKKLMRTRRDDQSSQHFIEIDRQIGNKKPRIRMRGFSFSCR
jgi:hypothetical protein